MTDEAIRKAFDKDEPQFAFELELDGLDAIIANRVLTYYRKGYRAAMERLEQVGRVEDEFDYIVCWMEEIYKNEPLYRIKDES